MLHIHSLASAKKTARTLEKALTKAGVSLQHGKALDLLAAMCGHLDWNSFTTSMTPQALNQQLFDFELAHLQDSVDDTYGSECMVVAQTGFQLRYAADTKMCEYVRVCDPLGRELMYWDSAEWAQDPQLVMGAVLGALVRGNAAPAPRKTDAESPSKSSALAASSALPVVTDIDFMKTHAVIFADRCHHIVWRQESVLALLAEPTSAEFAENQDMPALDLQYEDEGRLYADTLTLADLAGLVWNPKEQSFFNALGHEYRFIFEMTAQDWFAKFPPQRPEAAAALQGTPRDVAQSKALVDPELPLQLYELIGEYAHTQAGQALPVKARVAGRTEREAREMAHSIWQNSPLQLRITSLKWVSPEVAGPFAVYTDGGHYDSVAYLSKAFDLAEVLAPVANDEVTIEDKDNNCLWRIIVQATDDQNGEGTASVR